MFSVKNTAQPVCAIIVAAGNSTRMGGENKLLFEFCGAPVLAHTLSVFQQCSLISEIVVVCREQDMQDYLYIANCLGIRKLKTMVRGGETRQKSVEAGAAAASNDMRYICIHDGARPLVSIEVIADCLELATIHGAATAAVAVKDTIKVVSADGFVVETPQRSELYAVQTPQIFRLSLYKKAIEAAEKSGADYTDDCQLVEAIGERVYISKGDYRNIKITTVEDLVMAQAFLEEVEYD